MNKLLLTLTIVVFGMFALAANAYALPPKPGMPGGPAAPSQPQVPSQPQLPPCVECNEVFPTPTPKPSEAPKPSDNNGGGSSDGESSPTGGVSSEPEVLGLSDTNGAIDPYAILTVLGMTWVGVGLKVRGRK